MPFIKQALSDAKEQTVVPEGEYDLKIFSAVEKDSKKGDPMVQIIIGVESSDYPNAKSVFHHLMMVKDDDDEQTVDRKLRGQRRFLNAFSIPSEDDGFDTDDFAGCTATLRVKQQENKDNGEISNVLVLPPFDSGEAEEEPKAVDKKKAASKKRR